MSWGPLLPPRKDIFDLLKDSIDGCDHAASAVGHVAIAQL